MGKVFLRNADGELVACCDNCVFAMPTDIDDLIDCNIDGRSKDVDMSCDKFEPIEAEGETHDN